MLQKFDSGLPPHPGAERSARQTWMAQLARAPQELLSQALAKHLAEQFKDEPQWLRRPETGLMMVQGRAGGSGERFNLGEVTITRCALRLKHGGATSPVGVAYVLGRKHRQAQWAAMADALLQDPAQHAPLEASLLAPLRQYLQTQLSQRQQRARSTQVDFLTVAREAGGADDEESANP